MKMLMVSLIQLDKKEQHSHAHKLLRECLKPYNIAYREDMLVRGEHGKAVVAVDVKEIRQETEREAASFSIEMAEREDGSLFAGLSLSNAPGRKDELDIEGVTIRFYGEKDEDLRVALDPTDGDKLTETDGQWDDSGFWFVPYVSEGNYVVIR